MLTANRSQAELLIQFKQVTVVAGVNLLADTHASQALLVVVDIAVAVQVAVVTVVQAVVLEQLHSLTLQVVAAAVVDMGQTSAGIVIQDILDAPAAADQLVHIIVLHLEQAAAAAQVLTAKATTALAVVHITDTVLVLVDSLDQTVLAVFPASHGQTAKDTAITAVATMAVAAVAVVHHTAAVGVEKELYVLFGQQLDNILTTQDKILKLFERTEIY
jgi:hypothetical protein